MGGEGSGRKPSEETIVKRMTEPQTPVANIGVSDSLYLPNYSGIKKSALVTSPDVSYQPLEDQRLSTTNDVVFNKLTSQAVAKTLYLQSGVLNFLHTSSGRTLDLQYVGSSGGSYTLNSTANLKLVAPTIYLNGVASSSFLTSYTETDPIYSAMLSGLSDNGILFKNNLGAITNNVNKMYIDTTTGWVSFGIGGALNPFNVRPIGTDVFSINGYSTFSDGILIKSANTNNDTTKSMEFQASKFNFLSGNVGIGGYDANKKLSVNGDISAVNSFFCGLNEAYIYGNNVAGTSYRSRMSGTNLIFQKNTGLAWETFAEVCAD